MKTTNMRLAEVTVQDCLRCPFRVERVEKGVAHSYCKLTDYMIDVPIVDGRRDSSCPLENAVVQVRLASK